MTLCIDAMWYFFCFLSGVVSVAMDMKDMKLTVTGEIDPVRLASKLRKHCHAEIVSAGPPPAKKEEPKKAEPKKEEAKKEDEYLKLMQVWQSHNRSIQYPQPYHYVREEDPNACIIS